MNQPWTAALIHLLSTLTPLPIPWVLTGSLGMRLQGMQLHPEDIDIQTDKTGAYQIAKALSPFCIQDIKFLKSEHIQSHFGKFVIHGFTVEIMGDIQKKLTNNSWENPVHIPSVRKWISWQKYQVPVLSLSYEAKAYRRLGRDKKATLIEEFLTKKH
ncbi:MAG: hypothetical protein JEZ06_20200 [Anaerolineaceae bacterium]|nr:hypothetical protein [Anaerolineaceae bacterium]